jgi:hypothetical protein
MKKTVMKKWGREKNRKNVKYVGFEVLTAVIMKSIIFWDMTPCSPLSFNRRFGETYRLHLLLVTSYHAGLLFRLFFDPEDGGDMFLRNVG